MAFVLSTGRVCHFGDRARNPHMCKWRMVQNGGAQRKVDKRDEELPLVASSLPMPTNENMRCGFATLLGPSNSGKSTLLNRLVGQKVAIVTPKVQTTRCRIAGIATFDDTQVIFLDTPGIFSPTTRLSRAMVKSAWSSGRQGDVVVLLIDAAQIVRKKAKSDALPSDIEAVLHGLQRSLERGRVEKLCVCANKMDAIPEDRRPYALNCIKTALEQFNLLSEKIPLFAISARRGDNVDVLRDWVISHMEHGPWLYPEDEMTDMPARQLAAEVSREKAFLLLKHEVPYDIAVETTSYEEKADGSIRICQDILVARDSQKRIVTGQGGSVVKSIGMRSRKELGEILGTTVHLILTVKVRGKWKEEKWQYQQWGLDFNA